MYPWPCVPSEDSNQPARLPRMQRFFILMNVRLLTVVLLKYSLVTSNIACYNYRLHLMSTQYHKSLFKE